MNGITAEQIRRDDVWNKGNTLRLYTQNDDDYDDVGGDDDEEEVCVRH